MIWVKEMDIMSNVLCSLGFDDIMWDIYRKYCISTSIHNRRLWTNHSQFWTKHTSDKRTIVRVGTCKIEAILLRAIGQSRLLLGPLIALNNWKINCQNCQTPKHQRLLIKGGAFLNESTRRPLRAWLLRDYIFLPDISPRGMLILLFFCASQLWEYIG